MRRPRRSKHQRPPGAFLMAPESGKPRYRLLVLILAVAMTVAVIAVDRLIGAEASHMAPLESLVVLISALAAALAGVLVGFTAALAGVISAFLLLADFSTTRGIVNALVSGVIWILAAVGTGLVVRRLRMQVARREEALEQTLGQSLAAKDTLEHLLDVAPQLQRGETLAEVAAAACENALSTFGVDSVRIYRLEVEKVDLLAISPPSDTIRPGLTLSTEDFPDLEVTLARRRPFFVRDSRESRPKVPAARIRDALGIVSNVRLPIVGPDGPEGILSLSWDHAVDRPDDSRLAVMQRFADQTAIAWHNALRLEAQRRANDLYKTLERLVKLAPSFHITGSRQVVANAICQAAIATFESSGAALYRVEGDRLTLLERLPPSAVLTPGRTFPLTSGMRLSEEIRDPSPRFIADFASPDRAPRPWPREVIRQTGVKSALLIPLRFNERGPSNLLILTWKKPWETPDDGFLAVVRRFADQASLALAHSSAERLHARLEASLLPTAPVEHAKLDVVTRYRTGEQRLRLGGDFLGSVSSDDGQLSFVIGDVSGHGPDAAALGATLRSTWKALTLSGQSLEKTIQVMTSLIMGERSAPDAFATILIGRVDPNRHTVTWINAGHMPPLLITDRVAPLASKPTPPLGISTMAKRTLHHHRLPEHWSLFCYTDGLTDARLTPDSPKRYGEDRLRERLGAWADGAPDGDAVDELLAEIEDGSGSRFADDVAILLISTKDGADGRPSV